MSAVTVHARDIVNLYSAQRVKKCVHVCSIQRTVLEKQPICVLLASFFLNRLVLNKGGGDLKEDLNINLEYHLEAWKTYY